MHQVYSLFHRKLPPKFEIEALFRLVMLYTDTKKKHTSLKTSVYVKQLDKFKKKFCPCDDTLLITFLPLHQPLSQCNREIIKILFRIERNIYIDRTALSVLFWIFLRCQRDTTLLYLDIKYNVINSYSEKTILTPCFKIKVCKLKKKCKYLLMEDFVFHCVEDMSLLNIAKSFTHFIDYKFVFKIHINCYNHKDHPVLDRHKFRCRPPFLGKTEYPFHLLYDY
ncbi:hypothetical protein AGLY_017819 [Aphis glycines]|uniref:Uncharacterized protein n=1 Tax=Aphis glycines TaxID=307491 RepID=A0A6G0SUE3_APHGL|nr:hypothetical protein AGLY_017819 [Aphis glycines]